MKIVISCNTLSSLLLSFLLWNTTASQFARYVIRQQNLSIFQIQNLVLILFESFGGKYKRFEQFVFANSTFKKEVSISVATFVQFIFYDSSIDIT